MLMANNSSTAPAAKKTGLQIFAQICASITIILRGLLCAVCLKTVGGINEALLNTGKGVNFVKAGNSTPDSNTIFLLVLVFYGMIGLLSYVPSILTIIFACMKKARSGIVIAGAIAFGATLLVDILCAVVIAYFNHY